MCIRDSPADSEYMEHAKSSLGKFRSVFPSSEECFFNELQEGARYTVCLLYTSVVGSFGSHVDRVVSVVAGVHFIALLLEEQLSLIHI